MTMAPEIVRFLASEQHGQVVLGGHPLVDRFEQRPAADGLEYAVLLKPSEETPWPNEDLQPWPAREADVELSGDLPPPDRFLSAIPNAEYVTYICDFDPPEDMEPYWSAKVWLKAEA